MRDTRSILRRRLVLLLVVFSFNCGRAFSQDAKKGNSDTTSETHADEGASGLPKEKSIDLGNGVTMEFVLIPAGTFYMGSPSSESGRDDDEGPARSVQITRPFYMSKCEVTQDQYMAVTGTNPSHFSGPNLPVEQVSWKDAVSFCDVLGHSARLPTEAEWEYACRAGSKTPFSFGDNDSRLGDYAWYYRNSGRQTHAVGQKKPNKFGLYDMQGNVWEWCSDWHADSYQNASCVNPTGPSSGTYRVLRGGSWYSVAGFCRSADRSRCVPVISYRNIGFRIVLLDP